MTRRKGIDQTVIRWPVAAGERPQLRSQRSAHDRDGERRGSRRSLWRVGAHPDARVICLNDTSVREAGRRVEGDGLAEDRGNWDAPAGELVRPRDHVITVKRDAGLERAAAGGDELALRVDLRPVADRSTDRARVELHGVDRVVANLWRADAVGGQRDRGVRPTGEREQRNAKRDICDRVRACAELTARSLVIGFGAGFDLLQ